MSIIEVNTWQNSNLILYTLRKGILLPVFYFAMYSCTIAQGLLLLCLFCKCKKKKMGKNFIQLYYWKISTGKFAQTALYHIKWIHIGHHLMDTYKIIVHMWIYKKKFKCITSQVEEMDSSETPEQASSMAATFQTPSCDLLSHTVGQPEALLPGSQEHRGRLNLSDRKLSLQERLQTSTSPCSSPGLNGRYIYPSLPYSPITSPHSSPRLPRRPTVESHSVSITDLQVSQALRLTQSFMFISVNFQPIWDKISTNSIKQCYNYSDHIDNTSLLK